MTRRRLFLTALLTALLASAMGPVQAGAAGSGESPGRSDAVAPGGSVPALIEAAVADGTIDRSTADRYLAYALFRPSRLPATFRSTVPWRGTLPLLELQQRAEAAGTTVARLAGTAARTGGDQCGGYSDRLPRRRITRHFSIRYDPDAFGGRLKIRNYSRTLERSWATEVGRFGWPAPPFGAGSGGLYHVRIEDLGGGLYGFVTTNGATAGPVGNNPHTSWPDHDAYSSCMVLNDDYRGFPSVPLKSLQSTAAHEFNHAIQFGEGALTGVGSPDLVFTEGITVMMEDEVFDRSNDNYYYLWPALGPSMGAYPETYAVYSYWIVFRAMIEQFGHGTAGGGQLVARKFWELTSKQKAGNLAAMELALNTKGTTLADAFHAAAISIRLSAKCGGGYVYPYCLQEGNGYVKTAGSMRNDGNIDLSGDSISRSVRDDYAAAFIGLPKISNGPYDITLSNEDPVGGELRGSVVCDTGSALEVDALSQVAGTGEQATLNAFDPTGCTRVVLVVTNEQQNAANPTSSPARVFTVHTV
jgi:hypothetical protein